MGSRQRLLRWMVSAQPSKTRRMLAYLGFAPEASPCRPSWMSRLGDPGQAASQRDRWMGALLWTWLIIGAISVILRGHWYWDVIGGLDLLIAVPALARCLVYIAQRRPTVPKGARARMRR